jgi:hypothetical protein
MPGKILSRHTPLITGNDPVSRLYDLLPGREKRLGTEYQPRENQFVTSKIYRH